MRHLLNPIKRVDAIDNERSEPIMVKVTGFPDAKVGFKKMVLRSDFPACGIGRPYDMWATIVVGDQLADAILNATTKGVRLISGIPAISS